MILNMASYRKLETRWRVVYEATGRASLTQKMEIRGAIRMYGWTIPAQPTLEFPYILDLIKHPSYILPVFGGGYRPLAESPPTALVTETAITAAPGLAYGRIQCHEASYRTIESR